MITDKNGFALTNGDIIDIHQTVNGQNLFVIDSVNPLEISYEYDQSRKYEYDKNELIAPCRFTGEVDWEIVGNIGRKDE